MAANSFAFFFRQVCNKPYKIPTLLFAAHRHKLPAVMQVQEVYDVINTLHNVKHKTLIILLYSTGMRLSEIANLKIEDIDSTLMRIKIINGKRVDKINYLNSSILIPEIAFPFIPKTIPMLSGNLEYPYVDCIKIDTRNKYRFFILII